MVEHSGIPRRPVAVAIFALSRAAYVSTVVDAEAAFYARGGWSEVEPSESTDSMHARYYSPNLGRFVSVDPVGGTVGSSQSWNRYSYALNSPIRLGDPDGRATEDMIDYTLDQQQQKVVDAPPGLRALAEQNYMNYLAARAATGAAGLPGPIVTLAAIEFGPALLAAGPLVQQQVMNGNAQRVGMAAMEMANPNPGALTMSNIVANALPGRAAVLGSIVESGALRTTETVAAQLAGNRSNIPTQAILEVVASGNRVSDPQGVKGFFMYSAEVEFGKGKKTLEVLVDEVSGLVTHALAKD